MFEKDDYLQAKRDLHKNVILTHFNCRKMDEVCLQSGRGKYLRHIPDEKIFVIPEAVDPSLFDPNKGKTASFSSISISFIFAWSYRKMGNFT